MGSQIFSLIQIVLAIILIILIVLQQRGAGLGSTFGGDFGFYGTRRGAEKMLFMLTIIISVLFLLVSILGIIL